jgi:hypothetical protein
MDTSKKSSDETRRVSLGNEEGVTAIVSPEDLHIPTGVATADEAIEILKKHHAEWEESTPVDQGARG